MGEIRIPSDVALIVSILYTDDLMFEAATKELYREFGKGIVLNFSAKFDFTNYYDEELGSPIFRRFWRSESLFKRELLAEVKLKTNDIESRFSIHNKRRFNLDPGFLSAENFVLATTKNYTHRIYLRAGIFADLTLIYKGREFKPLDWTYPDYASQEIRELLKSEREIYLKRLREGRNVSL
ncbi:MAG: DUF4416 family protein [Deltaproteobacteria bacterium]|nr:DUF4416 family protein [Deltaproteobacteria bacterium]